MDLIASRWKVPPWHAGLVWLFSLLALAGLERLRPYGFLSPADAVGALPRLSLAFAQMEHGHFPWWDPYAGLGRPLFERDAQAVLDPLLWLARLISRGLDRPQALLDAQALLGLPLAAVALHACLLRAGGEPRGAGVAALAWVLLFPALLGPGARGPLLAAGIYGPWLAWAWIRAGQAGFTVGWALGAALLRAILYFAAGPGACLGWVGLELAALAAVAVKRRSQRLAWMGAGSLLLSLGLALPVALLSLGAGPGPFPAADGLKLLALSLALGALSWALGWARSQAHPAWAWAGRAGLGLLVVAALALGAASSVGPPGRSRFDDLRPAPAISAVLRDQPFLAWSGPPGPGSGPDWADRLPGGVAAWNYLRSVDGAGPMRQGVDPVALCRRYGLSRIVLSDSDAGALPGLARLTRSAGTLVLDSGVGAWGLQPLGGRGAVLDAHFGGGAALRADLQGVGGGPWLIQVPWRAGLRAKADGRPVPLREGPEGWSQVALPPGVTAFWMDYRPGGLAWLFLLGGLVAAAGVACVAVSRSRGQKRGGAWVA